MANTDKLNWGILSTARIANLHVIPATQQSRTGRVLAIASRSSEKAAEFAERFGIERHYGSYEELLADPDIDAIYNPLPNSMHHEWSIKAAKAGKHILCEKPLGVDVDECRQMIEAARKNNVLLIEAFWYRQHPQHQPVRDAIAEGRLGKIRQIRGYLHVDIANLGSNIRMSKQLAGGTLMDGGCYPVNLCRWLYQAEPRVVSAVMDIDPKHGVEVSFNGMLDFGDGQVGLVSSGFKYARKVSYQVFGELGYALVERFLTSDHTDTTVRLVIDDRISEYHFPAVNAYTLQADAFAACLRDGVESLTPAEDAIGNMAVIKALYLSSRTGRHVSLT